MIRKIARQSIAVVALSVLAALPAALAQKGGAPAPAPGPTAPTAPMPTAPNPTAPPGMPNPNTMPQPGTTQQPRQPFPDLGQRPIFLSGKVVLSDGGPPPDSVVIERVCNGIARPEAYTDSKGHFSFQLGQNTAIMADASVSSAGSPGFGDGLGMPGQPTNVNMNGPGGYGGGRGVSERDLMACEIRAALPGYRSDVVSLAGRRSFDNPDLGTIILKRMGNVEGSTISMTSLQAPKDAKKAFDKGKELLKKNKTGEAQKEFEKAVQAYPKYATAWFELGRLQEAQHQAVPARQSYAKSLEADAKFVNPYLQLALMAAREQKWQDVAETTDRVIRLDPVDFPQAYFFNAVANYNLQKFDAAEKSAREAQKLDTQHRNPKNDHLLGMILVEKKDYAGAAEQMKSYLKFAPSASDAPMVRNQLTEIEKITAASAGAKAKEEQ